LALSSPGFMLLNEIILFLQLIFINDFLHDCDNEKNHYET